MDRLEQFDGATRPYCPLSQQAADKVRGTCSEAKLGQKIGDNVVVVAGVKSDFGAALAVRNRAQHLHGLIPVERRHLDGDNRLDLDKAFPELGVEWPSANGRLQIETYDGNRLSYRAAVLNQRFVGGIGECGQA